MVFSSLMENSKCIFSDIAKCFHKIKMPENSQKTLKTAFFIWIRFQSSLLSRFPLSSLEKENLHVKVKS